MTFPRAFLSIPCILLLATSGWAQQAGDATCGGTQAVYFGNGVWVVSPGAARSSLLDLENALSTQMSPQQFQATRFDVAYNHSVSRIGDILESARQILGNEYPSLIIGYLLGRAGIPEFLIPDAIQQQLDDLLRNEAVTRLVQGQSSVSDVANHVASYRSDIGEGRKVVVVAHSQGNLFVNLAFQQLSDTERASFAMIPVASPDSRALKSLVGHVTFLNDAVIGLVQVARLAVGLAAALPPNDFAESPGTLSAHEFSPNYLTDPSARQFIISGVISSIAGLPAPTAVGQSGIITVTLTWGAQPDVDLHVFEPNGTHVYYASLRGTVGYLDLDDVTSFGPEHYYASCSALSSSAAGVGTFRVGVNYYRGSAPETANITVKVPGTERTFTVNLPNARGPAGDPVPIPVANVVVTKDNQTGLLQFAVSNP